VSERALPLAGWAGPAVALIISLTYTARLELNECASWSSLVLLATSIAFSVATAYVCRNMVVKRMQQFESWSLFVRSEYVMPQDSIT
jgi:hypothetical protein